MGQIPPYIAGLRGRFSQHKPGAEHREAPLKAAADTTGTQDAELIVAVFRTVVLLIALFLPRLLKLPPTAATTDSDSGSQIWLAVLTGVYNIATGVACLFPSKFGLRRPFIVVMDGLLITAWINFSQQWELFPFYYIVVVIAAMWFQVPGGVLAAAFANFFFFLFYWGELADPTMPYGPVLPIPLAINGSLLFLVGALVGYIAEAQEHEREHRLESQLLIANYQREIDLSTQMQPLLISERWSGEDTSGADRDGLTDPVTGLKLDSCLEIGAAVKPARALGGGDYFDVIPLEGERTALCIADVSGKSVRAQARLPLLKYSLRALAPLYDDPAALLGRLNETLAPDLQPEFYIAVCYVILDPDNERLTWCNAGHMAPLLMSHHENPPLQALPVQMNHTNGGAPALDAAALTSVQAPAGHAAVLPPAAEAATLVDLTVCGPPLGMFADMAYTTGTRPWRPTDQLLLFTDGLTDALSYGATEDGEEQVRHFAARLIAPAYLPPAQLRGGVSNAAGSDRAPLLEAPDRSVRRIAQDLLDLATTVLDVTKPNVGRPLLPRMLRRRAAPTETSRHLRDDITVVLVRYRRPPREAARSLVSALAAQAARK